MTRLTAPLSAEFGVIVFCQRGADLIERLYGASEHSCMLRRAGISLVLALVAALWGFSGVLRVTAPFGRIIFFIAAGFCLLSLLLSPFEAAAEPEANDRQTR